MSPLRKASSHVWLCPWLLLIWSQCVPMYGGSHTHAYVSPSAVHSPCTHVFVSHMLVCDAMRMVCPLHWNVFSSCRDMGVLHPFCQHIMSNPSIVLICLESMLSPSMSTVQLPMPPA